MDWFLVVIVNTIRKAAEQRSLNSFWLIHQIPHQQGNNHSEGCAGAITAPWYLHLHVRGLEASLVNVVEGESLRGVGAVLIHLDDEPAVLVPPGCHDVGLGEGHVCARGRRPQATISAICLLRGPAPWQPPARPARSPSRHLRHRETRGVTVGHLLASPFALRNPRWRWRDEDGLLKAHQLFQLRDLMGTL